MIKFPSDTELDLERVRTSCAGEQLKLTSEEKDLVHRPRSSKRSNKEDTTGHQRKRGKKIPQCWWPSKHLETNQCYRATSSDYSPVSN